MKVPGMEACTNYGRQMRMCVCLCETAREQKFAIVAKLGATQQAGGRCSLLPPGCPALAFVLKATEFSR